jgi:shikimate dehydrogenase
MIQLCFIIGHPVTHSLSPAMHNAGYHALGLQDDYFYAAANVAIENLQTAVQATRIMGFRGLSCTMPHKLEIIQYLDDIDPLAQTIGAVNTIVNNNGKLIGYNTDWLGTILPLVLAVSTGHDHYPQPAELNSGQITKAHPLTDKRVALLGAGGAARAMVYGLTLAGADVTIFNRTLAKAQRLAKDFNTQAALLKDINDLDDFHIILNATSIGMGDLADQSPIPAQLLKKHHLVFEAIYHPHQTQLLKHAQAVGAQTIPGIDMLLYQGTAQFELFTGQPAPVDAMRAALT